MNMSDKRALLIGVDEDETRTWGLGAIMLLITSVIYFAAIKTLGYPEFHAVLWWEGFAALLVSVIVVQAYSNEGVLMSWTLAVAALIGVIANYGGIGITESAPAFAELIGITAIGSLIGGIIFGTLGFVIGWSLREALPATAVS